MSTEQLVRKTVTALFCDVTGSTRLGEQVDPETMRRVLLRYFEEMRAVLERHGGTVEKFIGDAVMAVFGVPVVHEDDALRAVRAAAEMRRALDRLNDELEPRYGIRLEVRIGINTGEVVAGDATTQQTVATGDAINVAMRLQQAADAGAILLGRETYCLVRDHISAGPLQAFSLKGKSEQVTPWRLEQVHEHAARMLRRLDAPFVGREAERSKLEALYAATVQQTTCRLAVVVGMPGLGKTRLAQEFSSRLLGAEVHEGRCLPYGDGITFRPIAEVVRAAAGIDARDSVDDAREKVSRLLPADDDAPLVCARVCATIGLSDEETHAEESFWALRRLFEAIARLRPLVLTLDDVHWAEPMLLDFVEYVVGWSSGAPILLLCLARPELLDSRPAWAAGAVALEPLDDADSIRLVGNILGAPVDGAVASRVADAAGGNPLFAEELVRMLGDDGAIELRDGVWSATRDLREIPVPPSITGLLAARLDRLPRAERVVIECASVVGKDFWSRAVAELAPPELRPSVTAHLHSLVRKRLALPGGTRLLPDYDVFRFSHILIRDAAYGGLPKSRRAELHERHADWLLAQARERAHDLEEIVGYHLEEAYRAKVELGPEDEAARGIAERGSRLLVSAGRRALARGDARAAAALLRRAFDLLDASRALVEIGPELGGALMDGGRLDDAEALFARTLEAASSADAALPRTSAAVGRAHVSIRTNPTGTQDEVRATAEEAIEVFTRAGDRRGVANALRLLAMTYGWEVRTAKAVEVVRRALAEAEAAGDARERTAALRMLVTALYYGPAPARDAVRECGEVLRRESANHVVEAWTACHLSGLLAMTGAFDDARTHARRATQILDELGGGFGSGHARAALADAEVLAGDLAAAERILLTAYRAVEDAGDKLGMVSFAYDLAAVLCAQDRYDAAGQWAARARGFLDRSDVMTRVIALATEARLAARRGDADEARALAALAVDLSGPTDALNMHAYAWAASAEVARADGRPDISEAATGKARALFERKGNVVAAAQLAATPDPADATASRAAPDGGT